MTDIRPLRAKLLELHAALAAGQGDFGLALVERALGGNDESLRVFLVSNELWGGSGSIADQSGVGSIARIRIERALAALGAAQMRAGVSNERTSMWVQAFESSR